MGSCALRMFLWHFHAYMEEDRSISSPNPVISQVVLVPSYQIRYLFRLRWPALIELVLRNVFGRICLVGAFLSPDVRERPRIR
jgi:hypothetical protein